MGVFEEIERARRAQNATISHGPEDLKIFFVCISNKAVDNERLPSLERLPEPQKTMLHKFLLSSSYLAMTAHENGDSETYKKARSSYAVLHGHVFKNPDESHSVEYMEEGYNVHMDCEKMWHGCKRLAIEKEYLPSPHKKPSMLSPFGLCILGVFILHLLIASWWLIQE